MPFFMRDVGGGIVSPSEDGAVAHVVVVGHDSRVADHGGMLQVAVGDGPGGIGV